MPILRRPSGCRRGRSPASWARNAQRRSSWLQCRSEQHATVPFDRIFLLDKLRRCLESSAGALGNYCTEARQISLPSVGRQRDLFPLPLIQASFQKPSSLVTWRCNILRGFANSVVLALNFLYRASSRNGLPSRVTGAQSDVHCRIVERCVDLLHRLERCTAGRWEHLVPSWVQGADLPEGVRYGELQSHRVDVLPSAALCDPLCALRNDIREMVSSEAHMFPSPPAGLDEFEGFASGSREEYVKLVAKQLRAGQLGLTSAPKGGGTVIGVGKPSGKQRAVWNGRRVSQAAAPPPKPEHLACPSSLLHLEATAVKPLRVSKRDGSCWFDQLLLPLQLRKWMVRPPVHVSELVSIGEMPILEINVRMEAHEITLTSQTCLYPVSRAWPMGFSWYSTIAESYLLHLCARAGMTEAMVLSSAAPTPADQSLTFAAATDDVMIFSNSGPGVTAQAAARLDAVIAQQGAVKNCAKDINDELNATCVGVDLEEGLRWGVPPGRCMAIILGTLHLCGVQEASPKQVHQQLGVLQWFDLLARCKLAVYEHIYEFTRDPEDGNKKSIPNTVCDELIVSTVLGIFWRADLDRPFLPLVCAADASTEYGFGGSVLRTTIGNVRRIAQVTQKQGDFVVLDGGLRTGWEACRLGRAHKLNLRKRDFVHVFCVRKRRPGHINILEGEAFLILLRWILCARAHHSSRVVILCDSSVWTGAAAKGRSSSPLNRLLRKVAALELAGDLMVHIVLVPSDENPSDEPSRGVRWKKPPAKRRRKVCRVKNLLRAQQAAYDALRASGMITSSSKSSSACSVGSSW